MNEPSASSKKKIAGILSVILWTVGFLLLFVLPPAHPLVWTSDALLLAGFWPLLFIYRAGWTWLIFGVLNAAIGFILLTVSFIAPSDFQTAFDSLPPSQRHLTDGFFATREHLLQMHNCWTWMVIGLISALFGAFRIARTIVRWFLKKNH